MISSKLKESYLKEILLIRKFNPSLNGQMNSELFTVIIRNTQQESHKTRNIQKNLKPSNITDKK